MSQRNNFLSNSRIIIRFWLPVCVWMGFIFYFSSLPGEDIPLLFPGQDILFHLITYIILSCLFVRALKNTYAGLTTAKIIYFTVLFGVIYGITDEFHQMFVPNRYASGFDLFIDAVASLAGGLIYR